MNRYTLLLVIAFAAPRAGHARQIGADDKPRITVNGEAAVNVRPDKILISFGIETTDLDILVAKRQNADIHSKAIAALRAYGLSDKDIQTEQLSIERRTDNNFEKPRLVGYFVRATLIATVSDPAKVEELVTRMLQTGVNYLHGIDFQTTQLKMYRDQAREMALRAAREKADKMARVLDQSIGLPTQIQEGYSGGSWYYSSWSSWGYGRSGGGAGIQNIAQSGAAVREAVDSLALGTIAVSASVSVTFELKK